MINPTIFMRKLRVALTPRGWILRSRLANGSTVCGINRSGYGGRGIYIYRDRLEPEFEHLESFLEPSGVFLDLGASTGIYTIKAASFYGGTEGTILAVEPFPDVLAMLYRSMQANGFTNVRLRNLCVGDRTEATLLWQNFGLPNQFSMIRHDEVASCLSSLMVRLDDLMAWEGLDRVDYLKMDVEGSEEQVLDGARTTISRCRPIIQMEVWRNDPGLNAPEYTAFRAPGSENKVYFPNESTKIDVALRLGWTRLT